MGILASYFWGKIVWEILANIVNFNEILRIVNQRKLYSCHCVSKVTIFLLNAILKYSGI